MFTGNKILLRVMTVIFIASLLAACGTPTTAAPATSAPATSAPASTSAPAATSTTAPQPTSTTAAAATAPAGPTATSAPAATATTAAVAATPYTGKKFTIGISNPFISSEYRTQMIQELKDTNAEYMALGITNDLVIESADTDVPGQLQQLQNLIAKNVDAILVNPSDINALNATLTDAVNKGIIVISVDQEIGATGVYDVGIDQKQWAMTSADWLAKKLNGTGNIVEIEGIPGNPANTARMDGVAAVLANSPNIKVVGKDTGKWDEATGQQVMSNFLASFPNLDGYWTQDGMAIGAFQALLAANPPKWPAVVGEGRCQFLSLWNDALKTHPDFETIAVANPPGVAATGLRIAVNMLLGKKPDPSKLGGQFGHQFVIPVPYTVTKDNFQQVFTTVCANKPPTYLLDGIMTDAEVQQFFAK